MAIEHINEFDTLNAGREKINKHAIDPANRAELNSIDAKSVANQANQTSQSAEAIAINTDDRLDNIIAGEMQDAEVIDARRPLGSDAYQTLGERLDEEKAEVSAQLAQTDSLLSGSIDNIMKFPTQSSIHSYFSGGDAFKSGDLTLFNEYLNLFSDLQTANSDYITKVSHGTDDSGWRELNTYVFEPKNPQKTIILMSGVHGGEKLAIVSLYNFLKLVTEKWNDYPELAFIKKHVRMVVLPIANASGVYSNTRNTRNGVDINRNYDYKHAESTSAVKGAVPFSEKETQVIRDVVAQYPDAMAFIDCHNMSPLDRDKPYVYYSPQVLPFPHDYVKKITTQITGDSNVYNSLADEPMGMNFFANTYGMISFTPEYVPGYQTTAYSADDMTRALNWFGNIILKIANLSHKNVRLTDSSNLPQPKMTYKRFFTAKSSEFLVVPSSYAKINGTEMTMDIPSDGYIRYTAVLTAQATNDTKPILYVTPLIIQVDSTSTWRPSQNWVIMQQYFEQMQTIDQRGSIVVEATIPVWGIFGELQIELHSWATAGGDVRIRQISQSLEYVPTKNYASGVITVI